MCPIISCSTHPRLTASTATIIWMNFHRYDNTVVVVVIVIVVVVVLVVDVAVVLVVVVVPALWHQL